MVALLRGSVDWYRTCCDGLGLRPTRSSAAGKDLADPHWGERHDVHSPMHWGLTAAHYRMVIACDYVEGLASLLDHWPPHQFAPVPVARGAIETCARVVWMIDPAIDRPTRARRMLAERIAEEKWAIKTGADTAGLVEVQAIAGTLGVAVTLNDKGMPWGIQGVPYPPLEKIAPNAIASSASRHRRALWQQLAGIAHGSPLGVRAAMTTRDTGGGPDYDVVLHVKARDLAILSTTVADVFVDAVGVLGQLTGWAPHRIFGQGRSALATASAALDRRHLALN